VARAVTLKVGDKVRSTLNEHFEYLVTRVAGPRVDLQTTFELDDDGKPVGSFWGTTHKDVPVSTLHLRHREESAELSLLKS